MKDARQEDLTYWGGLLRGEERLDEKLSVAGEASHRKQTEDLPAGTGSITEVTNVTGFYLGLIYRIF